MIEVFSYQNGYYFCLSVNNSIYYSKTYTEDKDSSLSHFINEMKKGFPEEDLTHLKTNENNN